MAKIKVKDVKTKDRFRKDYGDLESLAVSIQRYGLLHPIIVDKNKNLIAGERRLKAHEMLGFDKIEAKHVEDVDDLTHREIEVEENLKRKDFTWQEEIKAKSEIDEIKRKLYGGAIQGHGGGWGLKDTAKSIGESVGTTSQDVRLAKALEEFPELKKEKNKAKAWRKYLRMKEDKVVEVLADKYESDVSVEDFKKGDCLKYLKKMDSGSSDLVVTDPPFGVELKMKDIHDSKGIEPYDDDAQQILNTIDKVVHECYRILKDDAHMYIFFHIKHYQYLYNMLTSVGFDVSETPLLWVKKGSGPGGTKGVSYAPLYESFFFCRKGNRKLNKLGQTNVFVEPRVAPRYKIHPTEKPTSLLRKLITISSDVGQLVVDPFGGSGSTFRAAVESDRRAWSCELDEEYYNQALVKIKEVLK